MYRWKQTCWSRQSTRVFSHQKLTNVRIMKENMRTGNLPANMKKNRVLQIIPCKDYSDTPNSFIIHHITVTSKCQTAGDFIDAVHRYLANQFMSVWSMTFKSGLFLDLKLGVECGRKAWVQLFTVKTDIGSGVLALITQLKFYLAVFFFPSASSNFYFIRNHLWKVSFSFFLLQMISTE